MFLDLCFLELFVIISCTPLLPEQSVIPLLDSSKKNPVHFTSSSLSATPVDVVEDWEFRTPPPYKVVGSVVRAQAAFDEVGEKVIVALDEEGSSEKLFTHEVAEKVERAHSSLGREDSSGETVIDLKAFTENNVTKCNFSTPSHPLGVASSVAFETTSPAIEHRAISASAVSSTTEGDKRAVAERDHPLPTENKRLVAEGSYSQVTDLFELLSNVVYFLSFAPYSGVSSSAHPSLFINSTNENADVELFGGDDMGTVSKKGSEVVYDKAVANEYEGEEIDTKKAAAGSADLEDTGEGVEDDKKVKTNLKLEPQVIPSSEFAKNGIKEEVNAVHGCQISIAKGKDASKCGMPDDTKKPNSPPAEFLDGKYNAEHEMEEKPLDGGHFERTLWEKLIAGLKCSQRDCGDALRPGKEVPRYLVGPSVSRARKHSNGGHAERRLT